MRRRKFGRFFGVIVALVGASYLSADAATISVVPPNQAVALGTNLGVWLRIEGLGSQTPPSLGTFDLNLDFDPAILTFVSAVFGDPILGDQLDPTGMGNTINFLTPGVGTIGLFGLSLASASDIDNLQSPSFVLATLTFTTTGAGSSFLNLRINTLGDADGNALTVSSQDGSVDVSGGTSVPEPNGFWELGAVLVGLSLCRRLAHGRRHGPRKH